MPGFAPRPKGMWQRTYERLKEEAFEAERLADKEFRAQAAKVLNQINKKERDERFWP